jgi:hypothetical protein
MNFFIAAQDFSKIGKIDLVADAADSITNGFRVVFGSDFKRGMCWFHVEEAVRKKLKCVPEKYQSRIMSDVQTLQLCQTPEIFKAPSELFEQKWLRKKKY